MKRDKLESELWNCPSAFQYQCPREWEKLQRTDDEGIRYCSACAQNVYLARTPSEFARHGEQGHCVAVPERCTPDTATRMLMGRIGPLAVERLLREQEIAREWWLEVLANKPTFEREVMAALSECLKPTGEVEGQK